jgi:hypothetical protein
MAQTRAWGNADVRLAPVTMKKRLSELRARSVLILISAQMKFSVRTLLGRFLGSLGPRGKPVDRSRLVGMYLSETNRPAGAGLRSLDSQERRNGKFAQNRQRA